MNLPYARDALRGRVAVVAGATRGAGRGIAAALGEAGATVVCTGRTSSVRKLKSDYDRTETIEETAELVTQLGGNGIAIPHGKLPKLEKLVGLFARLDRPIDFESLDGQPVDLIFLLLAPEAAGADHLKALARVARLLREPETVARLRETRDADALYAVLAMPPSEAA